MISFEIKLTPHQIAVLKAVQVFTDCENPGRDETPYLRFSQFITTSRVLEGERLIVHHPAPKGSRDDTFRSHRITDKGRLVLRLIEMEVRDAAEELKTLAEGAAPALPGHQARGRSEPPLD